MSVLFLDRSVRPLPMIAVAIAAKPEETIRWLQRYQGIADVLQLREALSAIQSTEAVVVHGLQGMVSYWRWPTLRSEFLSAFELTTALRFLVQESLVFLVCH